MSKLNRLFHVLAALLSLGAAIVIVIHAGLPNRSDHSGVPNQNYLIQAPEVDSQAPSFTLPTASARALALEQARGAITIINFWATWCQPCRREMRDLQALYDSHPGRLRILAVNLGESLQAARDWAIQLGLTYDILLDWQGTVASRYQVRGLPTTFMLDPDHIIRRVYYGEVRLDQLLGDLNHLGKKA
ncbi:MAG: TlpA disulfide reductase family protein [Chloroflexi bacterium]|nr:TlpA disulfide reductase family protein [Chloroflexota bacterium]